MLMSILFCKYSYVQKTLIPLEYYEHVGTFKQINVYTNIMWLEKYIT